MGHFLNVVPGPFSSVSYNNKAVPTSMIKYSDRSYLLQKGSALELLDKEVNALESVQRELVRKITRAKYGLTEAKEE